MATKHYDESEWTAIAQVYDPLKAGSIDSTDTEPHDRAVIRAMYATYRPNKNIVGDPKYTIFIARLNFKTTEKDLSEIFQKYGEIRRIRLIRDIVTGFSKGYAFIEFEEEKDAIRAQRDGNKLCVDGKEIFVDFENERNLRGWLPRRLGGGLGGKKEAGQLRFGGKDRPFKKPIIIANKSLKSVDRQNSPSYTSHYNKKDSSRFKNDDRSHSTYTHSRDNRRRSRSRSKEKSSSKRHRSHSSDRHRYKSKEGTENNKQRDSHRTGRY